MSPDQRRRTTWRGKPVTAKKAKANLVLFTSDRNNAEIKGQQLGDFFRVLSFKRVPHWRLIVASDPHAVYEKERRKVHSYSLHSPFRYRCRPRHLSDKRLGWRCLCLPRILSAAAAGEFQLGNHDEMGGGALAALEHEIRARRSEILFEGSVVSI